MSKNGEILVYLLKLNFQIITENKSDAKMKLFFDKNYYLCCAVMNKFNQYLERFITIIFNSQKSHDMAAIPKIQYIFATY